MFAFALFMSLCVDVMVLSSAYDVSFTVACGVVEVYAALWDTSFELGVVFLNVVYALRPLM